MKYVSLDIETTGLDIEADQILEFGAIIEDTEDQLPFYEIPKFRRIIKWNRIYGHPFALNMNANLLKTLAGIPLPHNKLDYDEYLKKHEIISIDRLAHQVRDWLQDNYLTKKERKKIGNFQKLYINAAGKNIASFDALFLNRVPNWCRYIQFRNRFIDPGVLFVDWKKDESVPGLKTCKVRAGLDDTAIMHNAIEDSWDVIQVLRSVYNI